MATAALKVAGHRPENAHFANDASYQSVERLLKKLAYKCFARVHAMGLSMTLDDVMQEMNLSYVRCRDKWSPDGGAMFNTYLQTACMNNFNAVVRRPIEERRELGMVNMTDMVRVGAEWDDGDMDNFDRIDASDAQAIAISQTMFSGAGLEGQSDGAPEQTPMNADPAWIAEHRQEVRQGMANLSPKARAVVVELLRALHAGEPPGRFSVIAARQQIGESELRRIKAELSKNFGVKI